MGEVIRALIGAGRSLVHPVILIVLLAPMLIALILWVGLAWSYWDTWVAVIRDLVANHAVFAWVPNWNANKVGTWIAAAVVVIILAPVVIATALLIATLFAMPVLVRHVAQRDFPSLAKRHGGTVIGSLWNASAAIVLFALAWMATLPLFLMGPLVAPVPVLLSAYLNQRLFRYDALSEHADAAEMSRVFERSRGRLFLLGTITGVMNFIPPFNLVAPVYSALAFIHLCLEDLQRLRADEKVVSGVVVGM